MGKDLISVIIPAFNLSSLIGECLDSVIRQTYTNIEILVINDGSSDNTAEIVDIYAKRDNRVKLISQTNKGVSFARNTGLNLASGKYVTFIDGDDWVAEDYLVKMYKEIIHLDADIVKCGFTFVNKATGKFRLIHSQDRTLYGKEALQEYLIGKGISSSLWGALYKKSLFGSNIRFDTNVRIGEDGQMTVLLLNKAQIVHITSDILAYIRIREGSASRSNLLFSEECNILDRMDITSVNPKYVMAYKLRVATSLLIKNSFIVSKEDYLKLRSTLNYNVINTCNNRAPLVMKWKLFSIVGKLTYSFYYFGRLLKLLKLTPAF